MQLVLGNALLTNRSKMRLFEIIVSVLVGGFAVAFALSLFVEERALSLQVLVVLVLLLLAFVAIKYWNSSGTTIKYKRVQPPLKNEKPLNTTDLNKILTLLEKYQYSGKSYYRLGLSLGLLHRTLDIIKTDNNNSVEHCLREVLTKWLEKADNVEKPTWSALVAALRSINQNAVAEEIDRETDPVSLIIENHRDALSQSIQENLTQIARHLSYELEIKSLESLHGSPSEKIEVLLKTIKNAVYENYKSILKFADVLCKFPAVRSVRNDIQKNYSKSFVTQIYYIIHTYVIGEKIVDNSIEVRAMGRNGDPIKVPLNFSLECKEMRNKWAIAVDSAIKVIAVEVEEQELKGFLQIQTSNSDVKEKLNACHSTGEIMQIIIDHCSLVDLTLLEGIIERFKIEEAKEHINEYKEIKDDFCSISLHSLLNETIGYPSSLKCETLQLSVDKSIDERTLKDVQDLIAIAFESFALNVRIAVIKEGNSFTITCSFPLALSESLIATALKNLEQLKKEGLIKMTIGYSTVYSQNKTKMETVEKFKKLIFSPLTSTWSSHLEREKSQHITSVYSSGSTIKQLLVSLNVQLIRSEASSNAERKLIQELLLTKKINDLQKDDIRIKELMKEKQEEIEAHKQLENFKAAAKKEKEEMLLQIKNEKSIEAESDLKGSKYNHLDDEKEDTSSQSSSEYQDPKEKIHVYDDELPGFIQLTNPSLMTCQEVISKLESNEYLLRQLSLQAAQLLIPALLNENTIEQLRICDTPLASDFILSLSPHLSSNKSIYKLELSNDTIDDDGINTLVCSLKENTSITTLNLSYNSGITSVSVQPLKELIFNNKQLCSLSILYTSIDSDGVLSLVETLKTNQISIFLHKKNEEACSSLPYYDAIKKRLIF
ncbi:PREDICTED: uncharacterized protein LOC109582413 [Amphimedon queenslandica]|uniref:Death domain-containing protein n=1 Tax=Amphimedon queenslandica TaxID=400682 RepID=A0AAN0J7C6_AMPQE|nr:PREDICTED: uncharacterized protein LOC109582413 [Amphimedon queenslandica]|eukprot:XP_019852657.1 PREDICTED: uncharacterized protein LOC109582413 [Amphimedon queenslandica]